MNLGILFALMALVCWGLGDFLIEKSTRKLGDALSLFYITAIGSILVLPFVWGDIGSLSQGDMRSELLLLLGAGVISLVASLFEFEALRIGKIAVIDPIYALETLVTIALGGLILKEWLTLNQSMLVIGLVLGIALISIRSFSHVKNIRLEKGIVYALFAVLFMGGENFLTGVGSRITDPLLATWAIDTVIALAMLIYIIASKKILLIPSQLRNHFNLIFWVSIFDNAAWIAFAYSVLYIPIGLATAISEAFIVMGVLLGLFINREKLKPHQFSGIALTVLAAITLSYLSG